MSDPSPPADAGPPSAPLAPADAAPVAAPAAPPSLLGRILGSVGMDLGPLRRHRELRLLFFGQLVTFFGSMLTFVALPYQLYALTGSSLAVGMLGLVQLVPLLATAFLGGALADAVDRRRMVLVTELGLAFVSLGLAVNSGLDHPRAWPLFVAAGLSSALSGLQRPSLEALVPRLVSREEMPATAALSAFRGNLGMIAGPAVGGVLVATAGLTVTYAVDVLTFLVSLVALRLMRAVPPPPGADSPSLRGVLEGLRYAGSRPELIGTYVVDIVAMVFGMPMALFPALAERLGGPSVLGLLYAAPPVGSLVATMTSRWAARVHRHGLAVLLAAGAWGAAIVAFGLTANLGAALAWLALAGAADMLSGVFRTTIWNQTIPDTLRGRLASIELVSYSSGPLLGNVESGVVAALWGVRASVLSGGALCVVGVALCAVLLPAFRRYDARVFQLRGS